jgi:hypothetical protein
MIRDSIAGRPANRRLKRKELTFKMRLAPYSK